MEYDFDKHEKRHYEKYEYSYGMIAVSEDFKKVLLVKNRSQIWGFPKGHQNDFETPYQTVAREMQEELGIEIMIDEQNTLGKTSFKFPYKYSKFLLNKHCKEQILKKERPYWNKTGYMVKKVILYIIRLDKNIAKNIKLSDEIFEYAWLSWDSAEKLLSKNQSYHLTPFIEARDIIHEFVNNKNI